MSSAQGITGRGNRDYHGAADVLKGRLASDPRFDQMPPVFPDNLCDKCIKAGVSEIDHCWPVHWRGKDKKNV